MIYLGQDDDGTWTFAPRGAAATYSGHGSAPLPVSFLTLVPHGRQWWIATWMRDNDDIDIDLYVDIVHPPGSVTDSCLRVVDLDLDVIRRRGGAVVLDDEDEFELHGSTLDYPPDVVEEARRTAGAIFAAVTDGIPPFSQPPARWLAAGKAASEQIT